MEDPHAWAAGTPYEVKRQLAHLVKQWAETAPGVPAGLRKDGGNVAWTLDTCGTFPYFGSETVTARECSTGKRHLGGVGYCGANACPSCNPFNTARRREALVAQVPANLHAGRHVHFVATLRHRRGVDLQEFIRTFSAIHAAQQDDVAWRGQKENRRQRREFVPRSVLGFVRASEVTYGESGWHYHIHFLLTLAPHVDLDEFKAWIQAFWERKAREHGRTADWSRQAGWFTEVKPAQLAHVVMYGTKTADLEALDAKTLAHVGAGEVLGAYSKKGSAPWDVVHTGGPERYVELRIASRRHRWFAVGGCWRTPALEAVESDEGASALRETVGEEIAQMPAAQWRSLPRSVRAWILGVLHNHAGVARADFQLVWRGVMRRYPMPTAPDASPPIRMPEPLDGPGAPESRPNVPTIGGPRVPAQLALAGVA